MCAAEKRKLLITVCSLLLCFTTLVSVSFAWIALSRAPEITGIETTVGANGSLEIALLNEITYSDPSLIRTTVGDSQVAQDAEKSNLSWGNVIDLSDEGYGLGQVSMLPSSLNVMDSEDNRDIVKSSMLSTVEFGSDGRAGNVDLETISAVFSEDKFTYYLENQSYGVRGIGTTPAISPQQHALTNAKSMVSTYTSAASEITEAAWSAHGGELLDIFLRRYLWNSNEFEKMDAAALHDMTLKVYRAYSYFDAALRQVMIGYAASVMDDMEQFRELRETVENTGVPLPDVLETLPISIPSEVVERIRAVDEGKKELQAAVLAFDDLRGSRFSWEQISPMMNVLINGNRAFLGEHKLSSAKAYMSAKDAAVLTLPPGSGRLAEAADYCGNYSIIFDYSEAFVVEVITVSAEKTPCLQQMMEILQQWEPAGQKSAVSSAELEDIYGFAIDMAFRSNSDTQLLLQTEAVARVNGEKQALQTSGNGSSICLNAEQFSEERIVNLMDAMRIGFLDNQNNLLAIAKMNTSNYTKTKDGISALLYLYEYDVDDGIVTIGKRREDGVITELTDGCASVVTTVVWLDGDYVDNSMATIRGQSVQGILNLQFASSIDLKPAQLTIEPMQ